MRLRGVLAAAAVGVLTTGILAEVEEEGGDQVLVWLS